MPCLLTVVGSANQPRPPSARRMIAHKLAAAPPEYPQLLKRWPEFRTEADLDAYLAARDLRIPVWTADDIGADPERLGLSGSPTQVLKVDFVVIEKRESKEIPPLPEGATILVRELIEEYIL